MIPRDRRELRSRFAGSALRACSAKDRRDAVAYTRWRRRTRRYRLLWIAAVESDERMAFQLASRIHLRRAS